MSVAVVTEHVPINEVVNHITRKDIILSKLKILNFSLQKDFGIEKPKIAVLGLNPHAGDEGFGWQRRRDQFIKPAVKDAKQQNIFVFGTYSADAFFARGMYEKFDAVLGHVSRPGIDSISNLLPLVKV